MARESIKDTGLSDIGSSDDGNARIHGDRVRERDPGR